MSDTEENQQIQENTSKTLGENLSAAYHDGAEWRGSHPMNEVKGVTAIEDVVWAPLLHSHS